MFGRVHRIIWRNEQSNNYYRYDTKDVQSWKFAVFSKSSFSKTEGDGHKRLRIRVQGDKLYKLHPVDIAEQKKSFVLLDCEILLAADVHIHQFVMTNCFNSTISFIID